MQVDELMTTSCVGAWIAQSSTSKITITGTLKVILDSQ